MGKAKKGQERWDLYVHSFHNNMERKLGPNLFTGIGW